MSTTTTSPKKRVAKKAATKKRVAKKAVAKKRVAKKAVAKAGARKAVAKGSATKRSATKKPGAKKASSKRPSARGSSKSSIGNRNKIGARNLTARSEEVRVERLQRRRSVVIVLLALSAAAAIGIGLIRSPLMAIDSVAVSGASFVDEQVILDAAGVPIGSPLLDLPLEVTAARVESVPEIRSATVTRSFSGVVQIEVVEREPTMALRSNDGFVLVDDDGRQVRTAAIAPDGFLPVIGLEATGVPGDPAPPGSTAVLRLMGEITPPVRAAVSEVIVSGDQLALRLIDGGRVVLGDDEQLNAKVVSLETLLISVDLRCVHEIDLTVPSAPALSRIGEKGNPRAGLDDLTLCS